MKLGLPKKLIWLSNVKGVSAPLSKPPLMTTCEGQVKLSVTVVVAVFVIATSVTVAAVVVASAGKIEVNVVLVTIMVVVEVNTTAVLTLSMVVAAVLVAVTVDVLTILDSHRTPTLHTADGITHNCREGRSRNHYSKA